MAEDGWELGTMHGRLDETESPVAGTGRLCGSELSDVCQSILNAEIRNGLVHGRDFAIDLQKGKHPNQIEFDAAPRNLIQSISQRVLDSRKISLFTALLDNYNRNTGVAEITTPQKEQEVSDFLDEILQSPPMRVAFDWLASHNMVARDPAQFKAQLYQMWFRLYTREVRNDTCGFEHVFVGESKNGEISGLHNWLQFYRLEQTTELDYRGYIFPRRMGGGEASPVTADDLIISVQFNIAGEAKNVSSIWLGTSPGFELALYTLCFVAGSEKNIVQLENTSGRYEIEIRCYRIHSKYGDKIGSAFPVLISKHPKQGSLPIQHTQQNPSGPYQQAPPQQAQQYQPYPPSQQTYPQQQPNAANQGCLDIILEIVKSIFGKSSK